VEYIECLACNEFIHPDDYPDGGRTCPDCTNWANRESSRTLAVLPVSGYSNGNLREEAK
jgi:hypothetical protein